MQPQLIAGRYHVLRAIGRGGMGTVWLCRDEVLGREVAVKQIGAVPGESATETKRAMREARSAAAFNHPNAVAVYDVVDHDARPWLVMEYVEGQNLADEISRAGHLSPQRVADIGSQLAGALARAHERRIIHRDIKPANVLIDRAGRPKISDFGIARGHGDDQLTAVGFLTGTPGYLSPELARGEDPHPASDVWALGATLYAAVEGQPPFEARSNPIALLRAIATERPRPMTQAGALRPAIEAMMDADPASRWDMATSAERLGRLADLTNTADVAVAMPGQPAATQVLVAPLVDPTRSLDVAAPPPEANQQLGAGPPAPSLDQTARLDVASAGAGAASAPSLDQTARLDVAAAGAAWAPSLDQTARLEAVAGPPAPAPPRDNRGSNRRRIPLLLVALAVAVLGVGFLLSQLGGQDGTPAGTTEVKASNKPAAPTRTTTPVAPQNSVPPSPSGGEQGGNNAGRDRDTDKKLEEFLSSYYSDVTKDTDRTWEQLSPRMQNAARGRGGYDGFWATIDKVRVNEFRANESGTGAVANLTYTRKDGTKSTETHEFTFVNDDESYLIDSDRNLG